MLTKKTKGRQNYYHGYFTALLDIIREVGHGSYDAFLSITDELIEQAVKDVIKETEIETENIKEGN